MSFMNFLRLVVGAAFAVVVAAVAVGYLQDQKQGDVAATAFVMSPGMQVVLDTTFTEERLRPEVRKQIKRKYAQQRLSTDQVDRIVTEMISTLDQDRDMTQAQMIALAPDYFSQEELEAMAAFWSTPEGLSLGPKTVTLPLEIQKMIRRDVPEDEIVAFAQNYVTPAEQAAASSLDMMLGGAEAAVQKGEAFKAAYKAAAALEMAEVHADRTARVLQILKE